MKPRHLLIKCEARARTAFTIVEVLLVIAIIAILMAISAAAVVRYTTTQQGYNTQSLLRKLRSRLDSQMRLVSQKAMQEPIGTGSTNPSGMLNDILGTSSSSPGLANLNPERARVIWVKLRLQQAFPNSFNEALKPDNGFSFGSGATLPALPTFKQNLTNAGISYIAGNTIAQPNTYVESSACLLLSLQQGQGGGGISAENIGPSFLKDWPLPSPSTKTIQVIVDAWGTPIAFCRDPWQNPLINPATPPSPTTSAAQSGANNDPYDPRGLLCDYSWNSSTSPNYGTQFNQLLGYTPAAWTAAPTSSGLPQSFVLTPVIISAGSDSLMALDPTNGLKAIHDTINAPSQWLEDASYDNIYSTQLQ